MTAPSLPESSGTVGTLGPTRRQVIQGAAAVAGIAAAHPTVFARPLGAASGGPPGRLVVVFLRGGQDHLSTVVPYTDPNYYSWRPTIAIPAEDVLPLDEQFGLHPVMTGLHDLFGAGRLAVVVGAGNPAGNRSHFAAQDLWEFGADTVPVDGAGWLGRYLASTAPTGTGEDSSFRGFTAGNNVNLSLRGYQALGIGSIATFGLGGTGSFADGQRALLQSAYFGWSTIEQVGTDALAAADLVAGLPASNALDPTIRTFEDIATLLDADLGVEVATANLGGWDTHAGMGTSQAGTMRTLLEGLDGALAAFQADLDTRGLTDVTTVVMTEFGRRVEQNGSGGTDHGFGSVMLVMGAKVQGGRFGTLPPLTQANIAPRFDVPLTVDFRDVLGDVSRDVLGVGAPGSLFPGHSYTPVGVTSG